MILAIDVGNSTVNMAVVNEDSKEILFTQRITTDKRKNSNDYEAFFRETLSLHHIDISILSGGILTSSVPALSDVVLLAAEKIIKTNMIKVGPGIKVDVDLGHPNPSELGPDLLVGAIAGVLEYGTPLIIADLGTCSTISVINKEGIFLGGMIVPGVAVSQSGMLNRASHLPKVDLKKPTHLICADTVEAIQSGLLYGHAAMIDGMIDRIEADLGYKLNTIVTGGLSTIVGPLCQRPVIISENLMFNGLISLYKMNI